ncbi:hypothetical protein ACFOLJ_01165 [Rugamonas sp. CCM 8940]|uniref:hypothetical protein n=1 Tax=Rugamonas sp. CCM 8940 TaxID=2765359 RepID=UPI0018F6B959|nr:hypothetical protein [Rugamonas sp. CCM 8940]MBJ7311421.1 hypothetical protein [Rugamonas sp. CCM 8940]
MTAPPLPALLLRARLALTRLGPFACAALALCLLGLGAWAWLLPQRAAQAALLAQPLPPPAPAPPTLVAAAPTANQNLAAFYDTLGERRYSEQQVKILFGLAAKSGLTLSQGEYKSGYDKASRVATYQVTLPVKGSYAAIWQFCIEALRSVPFAALDELSFRRDSIAEPVVEARLRLTLYLKDVEPMVLP